MSSSRRSVSLFMWSVSSSMYVPIICKQWKALTRLFVYVGLEQIYYLDLSDYRN